MKTINELCQYMIEGELDDPRFIDALIAYLTKNKNKIDMPDGSGFSLLRRAVVRGHLPIIRLLVEQGANLHLTDEQGLTLFMSAAMAGQIGIMEFLLVNRADYINYRSEKTGYTALHCAAMHTKRSEEKGLETIAFLQGKGATPGIRDKFGFTFEFYLNSNLQSKPKAIQFPVARPAPANKRSKKIREAPEEPKNFKRGRIA